MSWEFAGGLLPGPPLYNHPPWQLAPRGTPDLAAYAGFRVSHSDDGRWFHASGIVENRGTATPTQSVEVAVGVSLYYHEAFRGSYELRQRLGAGLRPGDQVVTEPATAPLRFRADGYTYILEIHIDIFRELDEVTTVNNVFWMRWWEYDRASARLKEGESKTLEVGADLLDNEGSS